VLNPSLFNIVQVALGGFGRQIPNGCRCTRPCRPESVAMVCIVLGVLLASFTVIVLRIYLILPGAKKHRGGSEKSKKCSIAIFLGSGGHTSEALTLVSALDFSRYSPRIYIVSEGDSLSVQKSVALESLSKDQHKRHDYTLLTIPRARHVHQSLISTPPTALFSLLVCLYRFTVLPVVHTGIRRPFADVLILNGPGTCFILCAAVYVNRFLGLASPRLIYIESFARVRSLSLSGKLLRRLVDRFVVQWPELLTREGRGEYHGWIV